MSTRCESVVTVMVVVVLLVGCGKAEPTVPPDSPRNTPIPPTDAPSPTATLATESSVTNDTWLQRNLNPGEAVVWYLGHCGYAVRTQNHFLIFDYQERHDGREAKLRPAQPSLENGFIIPDEIKNLRVRVFATHEHEDHFDRVIFRWQETVPDIAYYFGWRASAADAPSFHYLIGPRAELKSDDLEIYTINSHHSGVPEVAYLVKVDGLVIYHNGDYRGEYEEDYPFLRKLTGQIDLTFAFRDFDERNRYFEQNIDLFQRFDHKAIFPMHDSAEKGRYAEFESVYLSKLPHLPIFYPQKIGERFLFRDGQITREGDDTGGKIAFYSNRDGNTEIYIVDADGSNLRRLTNNSAGDMAPAISPDGTRIAFMSASDIYVMSIDGTEPQRLTNTPAYESHPDWSPDGTQITFVSERDGNREIYIMGAGGSNVRRVTDDPADDLRPDWSPDGAQIMFNSERDGNFEIYVVDTDGSNLRRLTADSKWEMFPQWSPDGSQIAYTLHTPHRWDQEIYVMDADGTNARQLTDLPAASENPIWSPDGSQIVFQSDRDGNFEIYIMDTDGSNQRRLTENSAGDYWPSWGPSPGEIAATEDLDDVLFFTHVCGFLISSGGKRILIDSLFRVDDPPTPTERVLAMRQGLPPFNDIDLILVTHDHHDHFDANLVGDNMLNNSNAVLVSTDVVVNKLQNQFSEFEQIQDRVIGIHLEQGEREQMNVAGIDLEIFFLSHGVPTGPNFGYFFAIDDINFFHTGDMNPEHVTTADLQAYDLPERKIDIAFVSGFRLTDERFSDRILEGIQPKVMVPMHFNFSKTYDKSVLREVEANFQNVVLFYEEMTWQPIDPETVE